MLGVSIMLKDYPQVSISMSHEVGVNILDVGFWKFTPCKINMEHNNRNWEDDFPLQIGDF